MVADVDIIHPANAMRHDSCTTRTRNEGAMLSVSMKSESSLYQRFPHRFSEEATVSDTTCIKMSGAGQQKRKFAGSGYLSLRGTIIGSLRLRDIYDDRGDP